MADDPSARIGRVDVPFMSPGQCGICGKNEHALGFADPRMDFEFYGTLYFCRDCVGDFAKVFDFTGPEDLVLMHERMAAQENELTVLRRAVTELETTLENIIAARNTLGELRAEPGGLSLLATAISVIDSVDVKSVADANDNSSDSVTNESDDVSESGPDDVSSPTSRADDLLGL